MPLYRISSDRFEPLSRTTYVAEKLRERNDLQRLLRADISPIGEDLLVIAEEYGNWEDSKRRIDLLCLSKDSDLVVVEIKRTDDGGHMELQAVRYAAMISAMTMEQVIAEFARTSQMDSDNSRIRIAEFLGEPADSEIELTGEVRIVLVSEDFSPEVTTAVLWLNKHDLDIICIRLRPHRLGDDIVIDATQIIPLPEAADYEVRIRAKEQEHRQQELARYSIQRRFWDQFIARSEKHTSAFSGRGNNAGHVLTLRIGRRGIAVNGVIEQRTSRVELYMTISGSEERTRAAFVQLQGRKAEIERQFGEELEWEQSEGRIACRIYKEFDGGWKSPESDWPRIQDRMIDLFLRFERAVTPLVLSLNT